ncbi:MAG: AAA family ATPase [Acidobacteriia bacterium]|nr:AAA family ATPase [Terriglobia bacterium]
MTMDGQRRGRDNGLTALLIAPDRELAQTLTNSLAETHTFLILADLKSYPARNTLDIRLRQLKPSVVLIDVATDLEAAGELIRFIASVRPVVQVVGIHRQNESAAVISVLRSGGSEFLHAPFPAAMQKEAASRLRRLRQPEPESEPETGRVVVFSSAKPGSGSSTLATHTAHAISKSSGKRVLLVDLDLEGGTLAFYLKLQANYSIVDALEQSDRLDAGLWSALTVNSNGVDVLTAPDQPYTDALDPARLHDVLEYARLLYDWVIVDSPSIFHRISLLVMSESDQAYLVSTSDLASLHLARKAVHLFGQLGFSKDRYQVVVNRLNRKDGIGNSDFESIFNRPVHASVPNDYFSLHRVISLGQPLAADCDLGKSIAALAAKVSGAGAADKRGGKTLTDLKPVPSQA